jgi:hypothetical protein
MSAKPESSNSGIIGIHKKLVFVHELNVDHFFRFLLGNIAVSDLDVSQIPEIVRKPLERV